MNVSFFGLGISLVAFAIVCSGYSNAQGFLEMPDIIEVPAFERETMVKDIDIPGVRDRSSEIGPRLFVTEFRLQGVVEFPELGITRQALIEKVESIRFDMMQEGDMTESGFSIKELGELSALIVELEKETLDRHVGPLEVQKLVFLVREQLRRRGISLSMMETIADTITQYYRERGFILAKAYIPKQQVRDGIVNLTLLLGELGSVEVESNQRASTPLIARAFESQLFKPVTNDRIDEALYLVNDIPGLRAQGFFSPGGQVGDTTMTVKVQEERWYSANFRVDNHGSAQTSENRAYADVFVHNPLGIGDEFYFSVLNTFNPDSSTYGSVRYNSMVFHPRLRANLGVSTNDFVSRTQIEGQNFFTGESTIADGGFTWHFRRSRKKNVSSGIRYSDITTSLTIGDNPSDQDQRKISWELNFDILNEKWRQLYIGNLGLHSVDEFVVGGLEGDVEQQYEYASFDFTSLSIFKFPFTQYDTRLLLKSSWQYAGRATSNLTQISLAGPGRARGFVVNGVQSDDGVYVGLDWIFGLPRSWESALFGQNASRVIQPFVFVDGAYGVRYPIGDDSENFKDRIANAGLGLKIAFKRFNASLTWGKVITDNFDDNQSEIEQSQIYAELQYSLR